MTAPDRRHAASSVAPIALLFGLPASLPGDAWVTSFGRCFNPFPLSRRGTRFVFLGQGLLLHRRFRRFGGFALGPAFLHLLHRLAVVVEAEVPGPAAEGLDFEARSAVADRAALLEPEDVAALGQREGLVTRVGVVEDPAAAADEAFARFFRAVDPQHVRRAVLLGAAGFFADLAGAEDAVLVHPFPDDFGEVFAALVDFRPGLVEQFAALADDRALGHL